MPKKERHQTGRTPLSSNDQSGELSPGEQLLPDVNGPDADSNEPFDPQLYVMEGLLLTYYAERPRESATRRVVVVDDVPALRRLNIFAIFPKQLTLGSLGLAAAVLLAITVFWRSTPKAIADNIYTEAAKAGAAAVHYLSSIAILFDEDSDLANEHKESLDEALVKRDEALAELARTRDPQSPYVTPVMHNWQTYYCELRSLGRIADSITENEFAIAYAAGANPTGKNLGWEAILLDGLGNTLAASGNFAESRKKYAKSIDVRRPSKGDERDPHRDDPGYEGHLAGTIMIPYLRMVMLCIAEENLPEAWDWQHRADKCLCDMLRTTCERNAIQYPPNASVWDLWTRLPNAYHDCKPKYTEQETAAWPKGFQPYGPGKSNFHWIGALLYHEAILHRLDADYPAAEETLEHSSSLEPFLTRCPDDDEYQLPLVLNIERARLAIFGKEYARALTCLDAAEKYDKAVREYYARQAADPDFDAKNAGAPVHKLPLSPARKAELDLLRGVALLGQTSDDSEGRALVEKAYSRIENLAGRLPSDQQKNFLSQFATWAKLANQYSNE